MIEQARDVLERLSADPKVRQMARMREEGEFLYRVDLTEARKEGEARGKAVGEAKGKRDVLFRLLDRAGISPAPEQKKQIESCDDVSRLDEWIDLVIAGDDVATVFDLKSEESRQ